MLKDITLGQYFPGETVVHKLDPRTKLILTIVYIVALFCAKVCSQLCADDGGAGRLYSALRRAASRPWSGG